MKRIAIFASGEGTNAERIIGSSLDEDLFEVPLIITDRKDANINLVGRNHGIPVRYFPPSEWEKGETILALLRKFEIDILVLAGFFRKVPSLLVRDFDDRMVNIHPSLLPKYGGKGMYGDNVHEAVLKNGETETGITVHFVTEEYDEGPILYQEKCEVRPDDTLETLKKRVKALEHEAYPQALSKLVEQLEEAEP